MPGLGYSRTAAQPSTGLDCPVQGGLTVGVLVLIPLIAVLGSDSFRATLDFSLPMHGRRSQLEAAFELPTTMQGTAATVRSDARRLVTA